MLRELHITGLGVIDEVDLEPHNGLTVLTGETGAGKTMITVAIGLATGARASAQLVRPGSPAARVQARFDAPDDVPKTKIGWQVNHAALRDTLVELDRRYRLPIYVIENGAGAVEQLDRSGNIVDLERVGYLALYVAALRAAVAAGADVRGYFVWSLLDNFEWGAGYAHRFGLVYVDHPTQRRIPKASARWYASRLC